MDTRKVATEYRLVQWSQLMQMKKQSGQSINSFCETEGISRHRYFYWQRKLREAACNQLVSQGSAPENSLVPNGWSRLVPAETSQPAGTLTVEVGGCHVAVTAETDPELLVKVCRALKSLC